jgi:hypothetical protein
MRDLVFLTANFQNTRTDVSLTLNGQEPRRLSYTG